MTEICIDTELVGYCGQYCGACGSYREGKCAGCHENAAAAWCQVRACCRESGIRTCAECAKYAQPKGCAKYSTFTSRILGQAMHADRSQCIAQVRELGLEGHARDMARRGHPTIKLG